METRESVILSDCSQEEEGTCWRSLTSEMKSHQGRAVQGFWPQLSPQSPRSPQGPQSGPQDQCVREPPGTLSGRGLPSAGAAGPEMLLLGP